MAGRTATTGDTQFDKRNPTGANGMAITAAQEFTYAGVAPCLSENHFGE